MYLHKDECSRFWTTFKNIENIFRSMPETSGNAEINVNKLKEAGDYKILDELENLSEYINKIAEYIEQEDEVTNFIVNQQKKHQKTIDPRETQPLIDHVLGELIFMKKNISSLKNIIASSIYILKKEDNTMKGRALLNNYYAIRIQLGGVHDGSEDIKNNLKKINENINKQKAYIISQHIPINVSDEEFIDKEEELVSDLRKNMASWL